MRVVVSRSFGRARQLSVFSAMETFHPAATVIFYDLVDCDRCPSVVSKPRMKGCMEAVRCEPGYESPSTEIQST